MSRDTYIFALYPMLIISIITILAITRSLRSSEFPVSIPSLTIFRIYLVCGMIGFLGKWAQEVGIMQSDLTQSLILYLLCSYLLFLVAVDYKESLFFKSLIGVTHLLLSVAILLTDNLHSLLLILSWYIFLMYPVIIYFFIQKTILFKNIGHIIIAFACMIVTLMTPLQLHELYTTGNLTTVYNIGFTAAIIGFNIVSIGFLTTILINEHQMLLNMALSDPLTGALNRRGLNHALTSILEMNKHKQTSLSVLAMDIDYFKKINDEYGHDVGDAVLQDFAKSIVKNARKDDLLCRLGGEEFVLVMPETPLADAQMMAERIRYKVESVPIKYKNHKIKLTSSFGLMNQYGETNLDYLFKHADEALYVAKDSGRNQVQVSKLAE